MIHSEILQVGDISMAYARIGQGEKIFVILPGLSLKAVVPAAQAVGAAYAKVAEHCTLYLFDRRKNMPENYSVRDMALDTAAGMQALGIEKAYIFGASQGGMIAQCIAALCPDLVSGLILGSTAQAPNADAQAMIRRWAALAEGRDYPALAQSIADSMYSNHTLAQFRDAIVAGNLEVSEEERRKFLIGTKAMEGLDLRPLAADIRCPALVIGCEGDRVLGAQASRDLAEALNAELILYGSEFGHAVYDEAPDYTAHIADFIVKH